MTDTSTMTRGQLEARKDEISPILARIAAEIEVAKSELAARIEGLQSDWHKLNSELGAVQSELGRREAQDAIVPTISDHALLRYIERVCGVDIVVTAIKAGASAVRHPYGKMVIKGSTVVTILAPEAPRRKVPKGRRNEDIEDFDEDAT